MKKQITLNVQIPDDMNIVEAQKAIDEMLRRGRWALTDVVERWNLSSGDARVFEQRQNASRILTVEPKVQEWHVVTIQPRPIYRLKSWKGYTGIDPDEAKKHYDYYVASSNLNWGNDSGATVIWALNNEQHLTHTGTMEDVLRVRQSVGVAGVDKHAPETMKHIKYRCPKCGEEWEDFHTSACDAECPKCETENITPLSWEDVK